MRVETRPKDIPAGQLLNGDIKILEKYSKVDIAIDLGTFCGKSADILSVKAKKVITIDVFEDIHLIENKMSRERYQKQFMKYPHFYSDVKLFFYYHNNVQVIKGLTYEIPHKVYTSDTIFVDGDHTYNGVKRDFQAWSPLLKRGGHFLFHDVSASKHIEKFILMDMMFNEKYKYVDSSINGDGSIAVFRKI